MFAITYDAIDCKSWLDKVAHRSAGAVVTMEGRVRDHNDGLEVDQLEYQIYDVLAQKEGEAILAEALKAHDIHAAVAVHRGGLMGLEDCAVYVAVSSSHRREAFEAASQIIDEIKHRLPIWKKEYYTASDVAPVWVNCQRCSHHSHGKGKADHHHHAPGGPSSHEGPHEVGAS